MRRITTSVISILILGCMCIGAIYSLEAQESLPEIIPCQQEMTLRTPMQLRATSSGVAENSPARVVLPFSATDMQQRIYALSIDLSVTFTQPGGYFSVLLEDQKGKQYLVYRDIELFHGCNRSIQFTKKAFETALFYQGILPKALIIYSEGCQVVPEKIHKALTLLKNDNPQEVFLVSRFQESKKVAIESQIARINRYNRAHQILWVAKKTPLSELSYSDLRKQFSFLSEADAYGFEHYGGGIYTPMRTPFDDLEFLDTTTAPYVEYFDWSDRHGMNWNTPCRWQQGTLSCWAQAAASGMEGYIKRYYGDGENRLVSVLQIIACSGGLKKDSTHIASCGPGGTATAVRYLAQESIMSEEDFPFTDKKYQPCENKPIDPHVSYRVEQVNSLYFFDREKVMHTLINQGPMIASVPGHAMLLSGYGVVKPGVFLTSFAPDIIQITEDHPFCGKVYWSFKNSFGEGWGNNGYSYYLRVKSRDSTLALQVTPDIDGLYYLSGDVYTTFSRRAVFVPGLGNNAYDADGDGYYRWGLRGKPDNPFIPDLQDGDDSDPLAGPMNEFGFCQELRKTDLYIRDIKEDKGVEPYLISAPQWESPDIWVRKTADDIEEHQNPDFSQNNRCYVYLRIHNKGNKPSIHRAMVRVYWSYASPTQWWESFHGQEMISIRGKRVPSGGFIDSAIIPVIPAGSSVIVKVPWELNPEQLQDGKELHACLMAEIVEPQDPYYLADHTDFRKYVQANNNVAQKNIHIINVSDTDGEHLSFDEIVLINRENKNGEYDLILDRPLGIHHDYKELKDQLELSYQIVQPQLKSGGGLHPMEFVQIDSVAKIEKLHLEPQEQISIKLKANFLVQHQTEQQDFTLQARVIDRRTGQTIGGNTYVYRKSPRPKFYADAIIVSDPILGQKYKAQDIGEEARYIWTSTDGKLLKEGKELSLSAVTNQKEVTLAVEAIKDGFLDRKTLPIPLGCISDQMILKLYPNPVNGEVMIELNKSSQDGIITITSVHTGELYRSIPTQGEKSLTIDLSSLSQGNYLVHYYAGDNLIATQELHKL